MSIQNIEKKVLRNLLTVFKKNFNKKTFKNFSKLKIYDFNDWDSLKNLRLLLEIEKKFKMRFSAEELAQTTSVKLMMDLIKKKIKNK